MKILILLALFSFALFAAKPLEIFFIDVEGGQSVLIVGPSGDSLMIDAGWSGRNGRDLNRIVAAAKAAKVKRIDTLLITHFHADHAGGVLALAEKMPIGVILDHGKNSESNRSATILNDDYAKALALTKNRAVKPGDSVPLKGVEIKIVASDGEVISGGGAPNPLCATQKPGEYDDQNENAYSIGFTLEFGKFRFVDLGDLTWNRQMKLACPANQVGRADLYITTHHGGEDSPAAMVQAMAPRVAIVNNGAKKGGTRSAFDVLKASPGLEDIWQLHYAVDNGAAGNVSDTYIANTEDNCEGKFIKVVAESSGGFTVTNSRNKYSKAYAAR
ncbi:MAG: MBL fold metallo-hydrolase [Bryobacteraceae bacterium]